MIKLRNTIKKGIMSCTNVLALFVVMQTANSACVWVIHQPEFPEEAKKFKKVFEHHLKSD